MKNIAFIDGQNLHMGTKSSEEPWEVDLDRFKIYLKDRYHVHKIYYFLGYARDENIDLYDKIQNAGLILQFRKHNSVMQGKKKGNVDSDIIFTIMKKMYKKESFDKVVLISGDGDYKMLVDFLIEEGKFEKILFPNRKYASSLYKKISRRYSAHLEDVDTKKKISKK